MIIYYDIIIKICFNTNTNSWNIYFLKYRKLQAVDQSTIQFWNFLAKGHST